MVFISRRFLVSLCIITCLFFINGCAVVSHGRMSEIRPHQVEFIKIGVSTKDDIVKQFGKPQQVVYKPNGVEVFVYRHGIESRFIIPLLVFSIGRAGSTGQTFTISFKDGIVVDYEYTTDERGMID